MGGIEPEEVGARRLVERMVTTWTASLLVMHGDKAVSDAYLKSRLGGDWGAQFGTLPAQADLVGIAGRAIPAV